MLKLFGSLAVGDKVLMALPECGYKELTISKIKGKTGLGKWMYQVDIEEYLELERTIYGLPGSSSGSFLNGIPVFTNEQSYKEFREQQLIKILEELNGHPL